jgi:hypothetical protein
MTREEIRQWLIDEFNILIGKHGEDGIFAAAPQPGKNTWTYKEALDSVLNCSVMENYGTDLVDDMDRYQEYCKEHGIPFSCKHTEL